jgi:hypothetical protein
MTATTMHQKLFSFRQIITCFSIFTITFCANATNLGLDPHENNLFQKYDTNLNNNQQTYTPPTNIAESPNTRTAINQIMEHSNQRQYQRNNSVNEIEIPYHSHAPKKTETQAIKIPKKSNYRQISDIELQRIISSLHEEDQKTILNIQKQISNWPESVFKEVRSYNEFMIIVNRKAKEKYMALSNPARQALEAEQALKIQLSDDAINVLSKLNVK